MAVKYELTDYINEGIEIYKEDFGTWILIGIVGSFALGVGHWGGFQYCALKASRGEEVSVGDVLYPFQRFFAYIVPMILITIGFMFCFLPGLYLSIKWYHIFTIMADRDIGWSKAKEVANELSDGDMGGVFVLWLVGALLGGVFPPITSAFQGVIAAKSYLTATGETPAKSR